MSIKFHELKKYLIEKSIIHDAKIDQILIFEKDNKTCVTIVFRSHRYQDKDLLVAIDFLGVKKIDILYENCDEDSNYVESYKFLEINENEYYISLDPDESEQGVLETDAMVFVFGDMKIRFLSNESNA